MLEEINIDLAIIATSGYSSQTGFTSGRLSEASLKKAVMKKAALRIMLIDKSKLSRRNPFTFAMLSDVELIIGDDSLPEEFREACLAEKIPLFTPDDGLSSETHMELFESLMANK